MIPYKIICRDFNLSPSIEDSVQEHLEKVERLWDRILQCEVVIALPHQRHQRGKIYHVRLEFRVPGKDIIVNREPERNDAHADFFVALKDAFRAAERLIKTQKRKTRGEVKEHYGPPHARVVRLFLDDDYGFVQSPEGIDVYFHRNSVLNGDFDKLIIGTEVRFEQEMGANGPQVTSMKIVGKNGDHVFSRVDGSTASAAS